jgi:hypothetical protein
MIMKNLLSFVTRQQNKNRKENFMPIVFIASENSKDRWRLPDGSTGPQKLRNKMKNS